MTEALQASGAPGTLEPRPTRHADHASDVERNRWTAPLDGLDDPSVIVQRTRIDPVPQLNLMERPLHMAQAQFDAALRATFVPTESVCALLAAHVHRAQAFAAVRYEEPSAYLKSLHDPDASLALASTWCLTGLAGVGKSAAMQALERLMPSQQELRLDECHPRLTQRLFARLTTHVRTTPTEALRMLGNPTALKDASARTTVAVLTEHVAAWFLRTGVSTLAVDELQFITQSDDANTMAAKYLLTLTQLNVPLTYIANFSLGWRLRERPQEEHQRLLPSPIVLEPEPPDSPGWRAVVETFTTAAPGAFSPECMAAAGELHRLTAGLNRVLRQLLVHALGIAHARRERRTVTIDDVRDAYRGPAFAINREDVEALATMPRSSRANRHRRDLVCPFPAVTPAGRSVALPRATSDRDVRLADAAIEASLTVAERRRAQEIERSLAQQQGRADRVRPLRAATPSLLDRLREGEAAAQDLLARSGKRRET